MSAFRNISASVADAVAHSDFLWNLISRTVVRWSQYLCQSRRSVEAERLVQNDALLSKSIGACVVMEGPFAGMNYGRTASFCSAYHPKILGTYERELVPTIETLIGKKYPIIVDIGAADGFYAVGFALRLPEAKVIAYEQSSRARAQLRLLAETNDVSGRLEIRERCELSDIMALPDTPGLLIVDCEGYEEVLLTAESIAHLRHWDFLIETHDGFSREVTRRLNERFRATHKVKIVETIHDLDKADHFAPEIIRHLSRQEQDLLLAEQREHATLRWMLCSGRES
jgi:hypothetical protein